MGPKRALCGRQLRCLVYLRDPWQWDHDLSLVPELAFWSPFPMGGGAMLSLNEVGEGLSPASI